MTECYPYRGEEEREDHGKRCKRVHLARMLTVRRRWHALPRWRETIAPHRWREGSARRWEADVPGWEVRPGGLHRRCVCGIFGVGHRVSLLFGVKSEGAQK